MAPTKKSTGKAAAAPKDEPEVKDDAAEEVKAAETTEATPDKADSEVLPEAPEDFEVIAGLTVSRSPNDGTFFIQFGDGRDPKGGSNPSHVQIFVKEYLDEKLLG